MDMSKLSHGIIRLRELMAEHHELISRNASGIEAIAEIFDKPILLLSMNNHDAAFWCQYIENMVEQEREHGER